jgi:hexosaminidase
MKEILVALLSLLYLYDYGQGIQLVPIPHSIIYFQDTVVLSNSNDVTLGRSICQKYDSVLGAEGYRLHFAKNEWYIMANTQAGLYYGESTWKQILNQYKLSILGFEITDYPAYTYRAMHLDVCRHFFSKAFIKEYIDQLAYYKINTFHWHLTDDQGWRIEIKKYPKLTEVGAWRTEKDGSRYGGYYTQDDIKEIVDYAMKRFITIIPEIEMPGHSSAALSAYPYLGCTGEQIRVPNTWGIKRDIYAPTDTVFTFFAEVMDEICSLFPGRYIHIGGDEAPKAQWKNSPVAQAVMKQNKLKNEEELQHYFMHRVEKYLNSKGKLAIGWGEVVKGGLNDSMVVMSWLSKSAGIKAARHGNEVVMAPRGYCYFDYPQAGDHARAFWMLPLPLRKVYAFDPMPHGLSASEQKHIVGGEATLWTEYVSTEDEVWHQLLPRLAALSEVLWCRPENKNYSDFKKRIKAISAHSKH